MLSEGEPEENGIAMSNRLFGFLILRIVLVFVGIVILVTASLISGGLESSGVVIFVGPFPIVFGSGPNAAWLILIGIILAILSVVFFFIMKRRFDVEI